MRLHSLWFDALTLTVILAGFAAASFIFFFSRIGSTSSHSAGTLMTAIFLLFGLAVLYISAILATHHKNRRSG